MKMSDLHKVSALADQLGVVEAKIEQLCNSPTSIVVKGQGGNVLTSIREKASYFQGAKRALLEVLHQERSSIIESLEQLGVNNDMKQGSYAIDCEEA